MGGSVHPVPPQLLNDAFRTVEAVGDLLVIFVRTEELVEHPPKCSVDFLDNVRLFWLTNTGVSSSRLYWENKLGFFSPKGVKVPAVVSVFPDEIYGTSRNWAQRAYPNRIHTTKWRRVGISRPLNSPSCSPKS